MTPEQFRHHGRVLIDWIADYVSEHRYRPVRSAVRPGEIREALPPHPPQEPEDFAKVWDDFLRIVMPGITHWQSPNFFAYFPCNNSMPSILGELLSAGLGVQGMLWTTSPACTELESHVLDWLIELLDLPPSFLSSGAGGGVIQDSASSATLCALLAARSRVTGGGDRWGGAPADLVAYASEHAHSSIDKANMIAGLGLDRLRRVACDSAYRMKPDALEEAIQRDVDAGLRPFFVTASQGTTSSGACDPVESIGPICEKAGIWLHVDGAMMGTAAVCPEFRWINAGLELADSYCFNPHKWMMVNFDCDCLYVRERRHLIGALGVDPEYLKNAPTNTGGVIDYRDWQIPLGRRFRALKLWFVLRGFGAEGLASRVRKHVGLAQEFAQWVEDHPQLKLACPPSFSLVCFQHVAGDEASEALLHAANATGEMFITHTRLSDCYTIRFCVGQATTERAHVERAWKTIAKLADQLG